MPLSDGSAIKLTTRPLRPDPGRSIQAEGIAPDIELPFIPPPRTAGRDSFRGRADLSKHLDNPNGNGQHAGLPSADIKDILEKDSQRSDWDAWSGPVLPITQRCQLSSGAAWSSRFRSSPPMPPKKRRGISKKATVFLVLREITAGCRGSAHWPDPVPHPACCPTTSGNEAAALRWRSSSVAPRPSTTPTVPEQPSQPSVPWTRPKTPIRGAADTAPPLTYEAVADDFKPGSVMRISHPQRPEQLTP